MTSHVPLPQALSKRIGSHIEKARPYYETLELTVKAQADCQKAAVEFQRAAGVHAAAKVIEVLVIDGLN